MNIGKNEGQLEKWMQNVKKKKSDRCRMLKLWSIRPIIKTWHAPIVKYIAKFNSIQIGSRMRDRDACNCSLIRPITRTRNI